MEEPGRGPLVQPWDPVPTFPGHGEAELDLLDEHTTIVVPLFMGLKDTRRALISALKLRNYSHEARDAIAERNLLAIGDVTEDDVIEMIHRTRGTQYSTSPHVWDPGTEVHVFRPRISGVTWYVKAYFIDPKNDTAVFISVHR
jgi:hypothetical protein